ncbi:MAG: hypothetical protein OXN86_07680 [Chloroflexota bacterium]|nr:hypothetical protein [Chloroflexota bacterium]
MQRTYATNGEKSTSMKLGLMTGLDHAREIIPQAQWAEEAGF